jgi:ABC-type uncharacterized transport system involved in gliding motility auxiliary subunit
VADPVIAILRLLLPLFAVLSVSVAVNLWALRFPARFDMTSASIYSISTETRELIARIERPVTITFFYDVRSRAMQDAKYLLEQYAQASPYIELASHDPTLEPAIAERFDVNFAGTAVFHSGSRRVVANSPGETEFSNALIRVTSEAVGRICFTDGHIESNPLSLQSHDHFEQGGHNHSHASGGRPLTLHERHGMGMARNALETLGYGVEQRLLFQGPTMLEGCAAVVVASPQAAFAEREVEQLQRYLAGGGAAMFLLEPHIRSGLEGLLESFGVTVSDDRVEDAKQHYWTDAATPAVTDYVRHRVTRRLGLSFFPGAAELAPHADGVPDDVSITPLIETSNTSVLRNTNEPQQRARTLALLATRADDSARIAVVGDGDFATNSFFSAMANGQLFLNLVSELTEHGKLLDIAPRDYAVTTMRLNNVQLRATFLITTALGPLLMLGLGAWVWWRRR